jgi:hypothetical protein
MNTISSNGLAQITVRTKQLEILFNFFFMFPEPNIERGAGADYFAMSSPIVFLVIEL